MAADKGYPATDGKGKPIEVAASEYKILLAGNLKVDTNLISHRVAGVAWSSNAEIYDHLASTVTAIESGQKLEWSKLSSLTGMNTASLDVRAASIELLEICRKELEKLDNIKNDGTLSAKEQKAQIAEQKEYIFGLLEDIRNANAPEHTLQWSRNFFSSLGSKLNSSFTRGNLGLAIAGVAVCVAMNIIVQVVSLAALGAFAPYALPFVIGAVALFWFAKIVKGVYNAYKEASHTADQAKSVAGDKVLSAVAAIKEADLSIPKTAMDDAKSAMDQAQVAVNKKEQELKEKLQTAIQTLQNTLDQLIKDSQTAKESIKKHQQIVNNRKSTPTEKKQANEEISKARNFLKKNSLEQARCNTELQNYKYPPLSAAAKADPVFQKINSALEGFKDALQEKTAKHKLVESNYKEAVADVQASKDRAAKTPTTSAQKTLKERLEDTTNAAPGHSGGKSFGSSR